MDRGGHDGALGPVLQKPPITLGATGAVVNTLEHESSVEHGTHLMAKVCLEYFRLQTRPDWYWSHIRQVPSCSVGRNNYFALPPSLLSWETWLMRNSPSCGCQGRWEASHHCLTSNDNTKVCVTLISLAEVKILLYILLLYYYCYYYYYYDYSAILLWLSSTAWLILTINWSTLREICRHEFYHTLLHYRPPRFADYQILWKWYILQWMLLQLQYTGVLYLWSLMPFRLLYLSLT